MMGWGWVVIGWWLLCGVFALGRWIVVLRQERVQARALGRSVVPFPAAHGGKSSVLPFEHGRHAALRHGGQSR